MGGVSPEWVKSRRRRKKEKNVTHGSFPEVGEKQKAYKKKKKRRKK